MRQMCSFVKWLWKLEKANVEKEERINMLETTIEAYEEVIGNLKIKACYCGECDKAHVREQNEGGIVRAQVHV